MRDFSIRIEWKSPGIEGNKSKKSHKFCELPTSQIFQELDQLLANLSPVWQPGTLSALEQAFQLGLDRETTWDLQALVNPAAWCVASGIFKRGVPYRLAASNSRQSDSFFNSRQSDSFFNSRQSGSYSVCSEGTVAGVISRLSDSFVVMDSGIGRPELAAYAGCMVVADEAQKTLAGVVRVLEAWDRCGRPSQWSVIGGGVVCDVAGFAAFLAKCPFELFPSTLLAMVDASIGGKCGVNFGRYGKNQIGAFAFPIRVTICDLFLASLPPRQFAAGCIESLKHVLLVDDPAFLDEFLQAIHIGPLAILPLLSQIIQVKANIISVDPHETGKRRLLNLGHSLGHALESFSQKCQPQNPILHGEAVAFGLSFSFSLSKDLGFMERDVFAKFNAAVSSIIPLRKGELSSHFSGIVPDFSALLSFLRQDKKRSSDLPEESFHFVLLKAQGQALDKNGSYLYPITQKALEQSWRQWVNALE